MPRARIVMEVGTHSPWVARALAAMGHEVVVANPTAMYGGRRRTRRNDRLDAEFLARQGRADVALLYPIQHREATTQQRLALVRARDQLVATRTGWINHVRGAVKAFGHRVPTGSAEAFPGRARPVVDAHLPELRAFVDLIATLTTQIRAYDQELAVMAATHYPAATQRLQAVAGVGLITSLTYVLLLEDPQRFARSRSVGAYLGLAPRLDASGAANPQLRITKTGDALGRRLLVSAAHYILGHFGPPCDLRRYGERIAARGGANAKKRAVVAVARKLAVLLHHLWVTGASYDPDYTLKRPRVVTA
jgi:transposase